MFYNDETIQSFRKAKTFNFDYNPTSISYNYTGEHICLSLPDYILIYNALAPSLISRIDISSTQSDYYTRNTIISMHKNILSQLSTYDLTILHKLKHETYIKSFSISNNDLILTCSDKVKIYNIELPSPIIQIKLQQAVGTFLDNNQFVIANKSAIRFFDVRNVKGPLNILNIYNTENIKFHSQSNTIVAVNDAKNKHVFIDGSGCIKHQFSSDQEFTGELSPDGQFYFTCGKGFVKVYDVGSKDVVTNFIDMSVKANPVRFNPVYGQLATVNNNLCLWLANSN